MKSRAERRGGERGGERGGLWWNAHANANANANCEMRNANANANAQKAACVVGVVVRACAKARSGMRKRGAACGSADMQMRRRGMMRSGGRGHAREGRKSRGIENRASFDPFLGKAKPKKN